jgi:hypothetical protein
MGSNNAAICVDISYPVPLLNIRATIALPMQFTNSSRRGGIRAAMAVAGPAAPKTHEPR